MTTLILFAALMLLAITGCEGLAGEPKIVSTAPLPTITPTSPPDLGHPPEKVSLARGAEIFGSQQGCQACHGITGNGEGATAGSFACPLPKFPDVISSRSKTISAWFAITTNGNNGETDCLMPPWKGRLDEQQRWDVTSYIYSLHYTPDQLALGKKVYADKCAACHGDSGAGDGPQAAGKNVPNLTDPAALISKSDTALYQTVTNGLPDVSHKFNDQLTDDERWAAIAYLRSLSWEPVSQTTATPSANATTAVTAEPDSPTITIRGKITNQTPGGPAIKAGLPLTLRVIDLNNGSPRDVQKLEGKTQEGGTFSFGEQPRQLNMVYLIDFSYGGISQISTPIRLATGAGPLLDLSFNVYEVTNDPANIKIDNMLMFISPYSTNTLLVRQGIAFANTGDHMYVASSGPSLTFTLPANATQITLDQSSTQQFEVQGNVVQSTAPVYPGTSNSLALQVSYLLPYEGRPTITVPTTYPISAFSVFTPQISNLTPADAPFIPGNPINLQDGLYANFALQGSVQAGLPLHFTLKSAQDQSDERRNTLAIVLFLAGIVLAITAYAAYWLNQQSKRREFTPAEQIIRQISELDKRFELGKIKRDAYEADRAKLKDEASKLLE
jgi:mono/diheme cytochrome c family protein